MRAFARAIASCGHSTRLVSKAACNTCPQACAGYRIVELIAVEGHEVVASSTQTRLATDFTLAQLVEELFADVLGFCASKISASSPGRHKRLLLFISATARNKLDSLVQQTLRFQTLLYY